jgi:hypothetical protein
MSASIPLRLLGLFLLSLAIIVPGCQAVFARDIPELQRSSTNASTRRP